jgi:hypothetical protein
MDGVMKKIRPVERYDEDQQYPSIAALEGAARSERRAFLKRVLAGVTAVGTGLLLGSEGAAQPKPRPKPLPPGVPPRPQTGGRPRPKVTPPVPGGGPVPQPVPDKRPCATPTTVKLDAIFAFCDERNGELHVTTTDPQVAMQLHKPGEGRRLASVIKPVFAQEKSCSWIVDAPRKARMEARLAQALTDAYQQATGGAIQPLQVKLVVHPQELRLGGVVRVPRLRPDPKRGCASCSSDASLEAVLLPAGLVTLALVARKNRSE